MTISRKRLGLAVMLGLALATARRAEASTIVSGTTFDATGVFSNGDTLGGTIVISATLGEVTSSDLTISGSDTNGPYTYTFSQLGTQGQYDALTYQALLGGPGLLTLEIEDGGSLQGYNGGQLNGFIGGAPFPDRGAPPTYYTLAADPPLVTGGLTPAVNGVPEPATVVTGGLAALMGLGYAWCRRRRVATAFA